ncbi:hypothetical protein, partial [Pseudomonas aeruginosa]|uniref:hypothetical protein n=1 Tax=Pseudomonas aeruginosa TaxID=287 RepID=UPI001C9AC8C5
RKVVRSIRTSGTKSKPSNPGKAPKKARQCPRTAGLFLLRGKAEVPRGECAQAEFCFLDEKGFD